MNNIEKTDIEKALNGESFRIGSSAIFRPELYNDIDIVVLEKSLYKLKEGMMKEYVQRDAKEYLKVNLDNLYLLKKDNINIIVCENEKEYHQIKWTMYRLHSMVKDGLVNYLANDVNRVYIFTSILEHLRKQTME